MSELPDGINPSQRPDTPTETQVQLYRSLAAATLALIGLGTVVFHWLEGWGWIDSFYFSVVAVTTVGFGDFAPQTDAGKLFTVLYIVVGISLIATFLDARFKKAASRIAARDDR
jgi:voltage-gated potassium channel